MIACNPITDTGSDDRDLVSLKQITGGLPCSTCLGGEIPKLIASEAPCCQPKLNPDAAITCCGLSAIQS